MRSQPWPGISEAIRRSAAELGGRVPARAPQCSLNRPTGPRRIPTGGGLRDRLERTVAVTRARKGPAPGASAVLLGAAFRFLELAGCASQARPP